MFKKIDKLVSKAFFGPFLLTYAIVSFVLFIVFISKYFEDLVGKDLDVEVYVKLCIYFYLMQMPLAMPLAVLLSSLMSFGNLGEHYEITAIKSAGISLTRLLIPMGFYAVIISFGAYMFNNLAVPKINLKTYSLLYDVRQKKPSMELKEGGFYYGLDNYSIRIEKRNKINEELYGMMIYDHSAGRGNTDLIMADTGKMYTILNDRYLVMELGKGTSFTDYKSYNGYAKKEYKREQFDSAKFVFPLGSFELQRTDEELFKFNKVMKDAEELRFDADSLYKESGSIASQNYDQTKLYFDYQYPKNFNADSIAKVFNDSLPDDYRLYNPNINDFEKDQLLERALGKARNLQNLVTSNKERLQSSFLMAKESEIELLRKFTLSVACFMMFLIGAPLGSIIKKGGLGVPVLVSIVFFLIFYVLTITGEKYAKTGVLSVYLGCWGSNVILFSFGMVFLRQARNDSRLFDTDVYYMFFEKMRKKYDHRLPKKFRLKNKEKQHSE